MGSSFEVTPSKLDAAKIAGSFPPRPLRVSLGCVVCALLPALLAAWGASSTAAAGHDDGVVRTIGAGFTGLFRTLDLFVAAPTMLLPIGTRALRAGLASALVTAICGAIAFELARAVVAVVVPAALERVGLRSAKPVSPQLVSAVSAVSVLGALLSPPWQSEACAPGGAVTGALLVLLALTLDREDRVTAIPPRMLVLGLALSYEPIVFALAVAASVPWAVRVFGRLRKSRVDRVLALQASCAFALGLLPLAIGLAVWRRAPEVSLHVPMLTMLEHAARPMTLPELVSGEVGTLLLVLCLGGATMSLLVPEARRQAVALFLVVVLGGGSLTLQVPAGPTRFAAPVLVAIACAWILGATLLGAAVLAIARARVPFAEASAALLVVLELVLPVKAVDDTMARRDGRAPHAAAIWNDIAWGAIPPASVLLVSDRGTMARVASARAAGAMRGDLVVVPAFDVQGREGQHALLTEPKLAPLYRDIALGVAPEELSLAQLSAQRAVLATFDPKWDRALSRHLVPIGLTSRFEPEPRGASDRKRALDAFLPSRDRLVRVTVAKKDPELAGATATLLRARAIGMAATGERDILARSLDDLRAFSPDDAVGATLVRRIVTSRGPIEVHDLVP